MEECMSDFSLIQVGINLKASLEDAAKKLNACHTKLCYGRQWKSIAFSLLKCITQ